MGQLGRRHPAVCRAKPLIGYPEGLCWILSGIQRKCLSGIERECVGCQPAVCRVKPSTGYPEGNYWITHAITTSWPPARRLPNPEAHAIQAMELVNGTFCSSKVILPHAINFRALRGANLVRYVQNLKQRNPRTPPCGGRLDA